MNVGIHLRELEQVFPVVAAFGVVVGSRRKAEILLLVKGGGHPKQVRTNRWGRAGTGDAGAGREHNDCAVQAHLDLQVALCSAVVGARTR